MSLVHVASPFRSEQSDPRRINRSAQWPAKNTVIEFRPIDHQVRRRFQLLDLLLQLRCQDVVRVQCQHPFRIDSIKAGVSLIRVSIKYALDNLYIWKRSGDFESLIVTKAIDDDYLRDPNQCLQITANVLLLVIGQYQCRERNHWVDFL